jgi:hypothetical protein
MDNHISIAPNFPIIIPTIEDVKNSKDPIGLAAGAFIFCNVL